VCFAFVAPIILTRLYFLQHAFVDLADHGTHCVDTIFRIAPLARVFVGQVLSMTQASPIQPLVDGIYWAVDTVRCDVLSLSVGTQLFDAQLQAAMQHAVARGVVVVCAAANYGQLLRSNIAYPAAFGNVICVGSHTRQGRVSVYSSAGRELDFLAPGDGVLGATSRGGEQARDGTSMAVPFVAGLAALLVPYLASYGVVPDTHVIRLSLRAMANSRDHDDGRGVSSSCMSNM
jgi:subtilisin family serine protease